MIAETDIKTQLDAAGAHGSPLQRFVRRRSSHKGVRDATVTVKLSEGQIIVENKLNGVLFSFPSACWPDQPAWQRMWVERLTPWWDMEQPQWSPTSQRLRESCVTAINNLTRPASKTATKLAVPLALKPHTTNEGMASSPNKHIS